MGTVEKIPLKHAELSITKFNEVAIPHQLGLLKNHRSNIEKCLALGDWTKIKKEEINAMRVVKQIKNLILEMDALRAKIRDEEVKKFDILISRGREDALEGIKQYLDLQLDCQSPTKSSNEDERDVDTAIVEDLPQIQTTFQVQDHQLQAREACLREFENLQKEVVDLHEMFRGVSEIVHDQGEQVDVMADNAEEALENVIEGEHNLRMALKYKKTLYPVVGAVLGACIGGPIGLIAGIKIGGLATISCGILGYTGGRILKTDEISTGIPDKKNE